MISTALSFDHLSGMFVLLLLHILAPAKELVYEGLIRWVAGHDDGIRLSSGLIENYQSFRGIGNHLKADATKPSQIADELFCLVVPTNGVNCSLLIFLNHWIVGASTNQHIPVK